MSIIYWCSQTLSQKIKASKTWAESLSRMPVLLLEISFFNHWPSGGCGGRRSGWDLLLLWSTAAVANATDYNKQDKAAGNCNDDDPEIFFYNYMGFLTILVYRIIKNILPDQRVGCWIVHFIVAVNACNTGKFPMRDHTLDSYAWQIKP